MDGAGVPRVVSVARRDFEGAGDRRQLSKPVLLDRHHGLGLLCSSGKREDRGCKSQQHVFECGARGPQRAEATANAVGIRIATVLAR